MVHLIENKKNIFINSSVSQFKQVLKSFYLINQYFVQSHFLILFNLI